MDPLQDTEDRLTALEIKASFAEDLLDTLNQIIVRQQDQIDALVREVSRLRQQMPGESAGTVRSAQDERPPHY